MNLRLLLGSSSVTGFATIAGWQTQLEWHFRMASLTVGILAGLVTIVAGVYGIYKSFKKG
jgi:hypothetical protein